MAIDKRLLYGAGAVGVVALVAMAIAKGAEGGDDKPTGEDATKLAMARAKLLNMATVHEDCSIDWESGEAPIFTPDIQDFLMVQIEQAKRSTDGSPTSLVAWILDDLFPQCTWPPAVVLSSQYMTWAMFFIQVGQLLGLTARQAEEIMEGGPTPQQTPAPAPIPGYSPAPEMISGIDEG